MTKRPTKAKSLEDQAPDIVREELGKILSQEERARIKVTNQFVAGYAPFTLAARGKMFSLVFLADKDYIHYALTTKAVGRVNLVPTDDIEAELHMMIRVCNVLALHPLFRKINLWELRT